MASVDKIDRTGWRKTQLDFQGVLDSELSAATTERFRNVAGTGISIFLRCKKAKHVVPRTLLSIKRQKVPHNTFDRRDA